MTHTTFIKIIIIFMTLAGIAQGAKGAEKCDTLFHASSAKTLYITTDDESLWLVIKNFNGGPENYYYDSSSPKSAEVYVSNSSKYTNLSDIFVTETEDRLLNISFITRTATAPGCPSASSLPV